MDETRDQLMELQSTAQKIHAALVGDGLGNKGLIVRMDTAEQKIDSLDRYVRKWFFMAYGAGLTVYAGWEAFKYFHP